MIYAIRHRTTYSYAKSVPFARCALRLALAEGADQRVTAPTLELTPKPERMAHHIGQFGEQVVTATIDTPHREMIVLATARVDVRRPALPQPLVGPSWESVRAAAFASSTLAVGAAAHALYPTAMTPIEPAISTYAAAAFLPGRPILEAAFDLASRIKADFAYDPEATEVSTPAIEAFTARHGVCQDFAHIMIAGLRGLGLPAAYVSGYIRTRPPPGRPRLQGADATHAWVSLWCGPALGWIGFDPTNALLVANEHIVLAVGRDYADIAPIGGIILGPGQQKIKVAVDVVPIEEEGLFGAAPPQRK